MAIPEAVSQTWKGILIQQAYEHFLISHGKETVKIGSHDATLPIKGIARSEGMQNFKTLI